MSDLTKENWIDTRTWMAHFYWSNYSSGQMPLSFIITSVVSKEIMLGRYQAALNLKEILPIELLLPEEKEKLRNEVQATGLKLNNREMNNACRILYTLKQIG